MTEATGTATSPTKISNEGAARAIPTILGGACRLLRVANLLTVLGAKLMWEDEEASRSLRI